MRYHYPYILAVIMALGVLLFGIGTVACLVSAAALSTTLLLGSFAIFSLFVFTMVTQTIAIDEQGITKFSLLGKMQTIAWNEISTIKPGGVYNPGIKIYDSENHSIEISTMHRRYTEMIDLVRSYTHTPIGTVLPTASAFPDSKLPPALTGDLLFTASKAGIPGLVINLLIWGYLVYRAIATPSLVFIIIALIFSFVLVFGVFLEYFRAPVALSTKGGILTVEFRSKILRPPLVKRVDEILDIHLATAGSPFLQSNSRTATRLEVYFRGQKKIVIQNFTTPNEEMYTKLSTWFEQHGGRKQPFGAVEQYLS